MSDSTQMPMPMGLTPKQFEDFHKQEMKMASLIAAMRAIRFDIFGEPAKTTSQQKGVHISHKRAIFYTKAAVKAEHRRIRAAAWPHRPKTPLEGPIYARLTFYFPMTQALATKSIEHLSDLDYAVWKTTRPDTDNSGKVVLDALTECGFWKDDSQLCVTVLAKSFGVLPHIGVCIRQISPDSAGILPDMLALWESDSFAPDLSPVPGTKKTFWA